MSKEETKKLSDDEAMQILLNANKQYNAYITNFDTPDIFNQYAISECYRNMNHPLSIVMNR